MDLRFHEIFFNFHEAFVQKVLMCSQYILKKINQIIFLNLYLVKTKVHENKNAPSKIDVRHCNLHLWFMLETNNCPTIFFPEYW